MKDFFIINSFIIQDKNTQNDIYNYIKTRYDKLVETNDVKIELTKLIKNSIIFFHNKKYKLTKEGNVILNDHKYYYSKIIIRFYKKYNKNFRKYILKEIRKEQQQLRNYLIVNKQQLCAICNKKMPLCLLEAAHLKPRCLLNNAEINDKNIVEFMCSYCHKLYDNGLISVYNGILHISSIINNYDLQYSKNTEINGYNLQNKNYFNFHYKYIYKESEYIYN
jgi:hypothetical protein